MAKIEGTGKVDKLVGTTGDDTINGAGGNDLIVGATGFKAGQELLVDGSFESARVGAGTWTWFKQVGGWQSDTGVEVWGKNFIKTASNGDKLMELDFDNRQSKVWQDVKTEAGQEYSFSFDASARPGTSLSTNTINVFWNDKLVGTVNPGANWQSSTFKFVGTGGTDRIEFRESGNQNDSYGGLIDNVSLKATSVAASNVLIGGGGSDQIVAGQNGDVMFGDGPKSGRVDASKLKITESVKAHVTWQGESAGYKNALGMYTFDKNGNITGVKMLFANASEVGSGGELVTGQSGIDVDLKGGERVGFFVAANAYDQRGMDKLLSDPNAKFMLVDAKTGKPGVVGQGGEFKMATSMRRVSPPTSRPSTAPRSSPRARPTTATSSSTTSPPLIPRPARSPSASRICGAAGIATSTIPVSPSTSASPTRLRSARRVRPPSARARLTIC